MSLGSKTNNRQTKNITNKSPMLIRKSRLKEMPIYASSFNASYTIEAAIVMPLFITLMVFAMFVFRVLQVQTGVQQSINLTSRQMAVTLGELSNQGEADKDVEIDKEESGLTDYLEEGVLLAATIAYADNQISANDVPVEFVDGGYLGFNYLGTSVAGNYIDIKVNYSMTFPFGLLGNYSFDVSQRAKSRKWIGYDKAENESDSLYVYITEHGEVYHTNANCTYLKPSVHRVSVDDIDEKRNEGGGKYSICQRCKNKKNNGTVFITDYGTAYHNDASCTEIKHNIQKVLYEDVKDKMRPCSKCGGNHK